MKEEKCEDGKLLAATPTSFRGEIYRVNYHMTHKKSVYTREDSEAAILIWWEHSGCAHTLCVGIALKT
jgi:hypothetical protein